MEPTVPDPVPIIEEDTSYDETEIISQFSQLTQTKEEWHENANYYSQPLD